MRIQAISATAIRPPAEGDRIGHSNPPREIRQAAPQSSAERTRASLDARARLGHTGTRIDVRA